MFIRRSFARNIIPIALATSFVAGCGGGGGGNNAGGGVSFNWLIPADEIVDGGPGKDGIPALNGGLFEDALTILSVKPDELMSVVMVNGVVSAYPHDIMDWHEVINDTNGSAAYVASYCPLTGSTLAWLPGDGHSNTQFGVSGLLYNSNLILYDRATDSRWSQMLHKSVWGTRVGEERQQLRVMETRFSTLRRMYPSARVLTRNTGWERDYNQTPYRSYRTNDSLLFPVSREDNRLHPKTRVVGIHSDTGSKVYQIDSFGATTQAINDQFEGQSIVAVGNSAEDVAAIFSRQLADGTILSFSPLQDELPNIMTDDEGNVWDVFGIAVSGPRQGAQLELTRGFIAYWFAWATFFHDPEIYFN